MRITEAAERLGTSPRMLRYRDLLGLLPRVRERAPRRGSPAGRHRRFGEDDLAAAALALAIEQRYDISPAALAFGLRVLAEPRVRAEVAELGRAIGRIGPPPARALDFEQERALRLLSLAAQERPASRGRPARGGTASPAGAPGGGPASPAAGPRGGAAGPLAARTAGSAASARDG
jgi:MerR family transcriptional regulator, copper efflux regulator